MWVLSKESKSKRHTVHIRQSELQTAKEFKTATVYCQKNKTHTIHKHLPPSNSNRKGNGVIKQKSFGQLNEEWVGGWVGKWWSDGKRRLWVLSHPLTAEIEKQTGTSYVYARLVLGATGRVACSAAVHAPVADLWVADVNMRYSGAVRERVLTGPVRRVPSDWLIIQGPSDGGWRGTFGCTHQGEGFAWCHHTFTEG